MLRIKMNSFGARRAVALASTMAFFLGQAAWAAPAGQASVASDYDAQDARLNAAYKALAGTLDEAGRRALRDEERQWIAGRDTACKTPTGTVVKNSCTLTQTRFRADELSQRAKGGSTGAAPARAATAAPATAGIAGTWGYRSDCDFGHDVDFVVTRASPDAEGTWADGTRNGGSQGAFKGAWRNDRLYLRFCSSDGQQGDYPACPAYSDEAAYVAPKGKQLAWHQLSGGNDEAYVVLDRVPKGGKAPLDTHCK